MPRALITGITGQDGSYLTDLLLEKGYEVHGIVRPANVLERSRIAHLYQNSEIYNRRLFLHRSDLTDPPGLQRIVQETAPDELYHLAGQSHVGLSFDMAETTCELTGLGTVRLLEMARKLPKPPRFFNASSSEIFGSPETSPQDERTPFRPVTPYGCAKAFATQMVGIYRQSLGLFGCNAMLYNHESPRRGETFVPQKICRAAAAIKEGRQTELLLGNLASKRDWGDARDYVRAMWMMLQHDTPGDYVIATGELHSVQELVELAFGAVGLDWQKYVKQDPRFMRPGDPVRLVGNPAKAKQVLNWQPTTPFSQFIPEMTRAGLQKP